MALRHLYTVLSIRFPHEILPKGIKPWLGLGPPGHRIASIGAQNLHATF